MRSDLWNLRCPRSESHFVISEPWRPPSQPRIRSSANAGDVEGPR
jgi:hypothetical protein